MLEYIIMGTMDWNYDDLHDSTPHWMTRRTLGQQESPPAMPVMVWDVIPDGSIESAGFQGHITLKWGEHSSSPFYHHSHTN